MLLPQHIVCIQYVILFFSFCQQRLLLRTIKEIKCTLPTRKNGTLCRFYYGLFTHNENANNSNFNRNYFMGGNFGSEEVHFDFKGGATTALGGATIAD